MPPPSRRPANPCFSSGPCAKRPGWSPAVLADAAVGRSHRAKIGRGKLGECIDRMRTVLEVPDEIRLAIVPASDTGAVEMALWSLLGSRPVDVLAWESFGRGWVRDVIEELAIPESRALEADFGELPDLTRVDFERDVVFVYNGTTSGVRLPDGDWIADDRGGLTICDATSAAFAMELPWHKLDVVTFSWQKALGGEAAHGVIALGPRAVDRLHVWSPPWPLPKIFRMTQGGSLNEKLFRGDTINTPSLLCVEDMLDALRWAEAAGGLEGLVRRSESNLSLVAGWVAETPWVEFLARVPETRSCTSICLTITDPAFAELSREEQSVWAAELVGTLEREGVAYDIGAYRDAPPGVRLWGGATVERADLEALLPWIEWSASRQTPAIGS